MEVLDSKAAGAGADAVAKGKLIEVDCALQSMRDAGFDLNAASGEVVDNSIEGKAREVRIATFEVEGGGKKSKQSIGCIAFGDNGTGIPLDILPNVLTMGFSTRYNQRNGMGRFGVGSKLAALSQGKRVDIYTRHADSGAVYHTYIDLEEIGRGEQQYLEARPVDGFPSKYGHLMSDGKGNEYATGTLVLWSKVDRLEDGGKYGTSVEQRKADLLKFLARTYRRYIANGVKIFLNDNEIQLHDPLFLLDNPRAAALLGNDCQGRVIDFDKITIDGHEVEVTVTLSPEKVRLKRQEGGYRGSAEPFKELHIADNKGRISILRHGREIYYDVVPRLFPTAISDLDRFIGVEVSFPPALDEYFSVRHVKRGAEPVDKLREEIRRFLEKPIVQARKEIQRVWGETARKSRLENPQHFKSVEAFKKVEETAPRGIGNNVPDALVESVLETAAQDLGGETPEDIAKLKEQVRKQTLTVIPGDWPGKELFELQHLNGKVIMRMNWRHPFMKHVYQPLKDLADGTLQDASMADIQQIARRVEGAVDLIFFSYAKAENLQPDPDEAYGDLRNYWGNFIATGVKSLLENP